MGDPLRDALEKLAKAWEAHAARIPWGDKCDTLMTNARDLRSLLASSPPPSREERGAGDDKPCKGSDLHCDLCGSSARDVAPDFRFDPAREAIRWTCCDGHTQITGWRPAEPGENGREG